MIGEEGKGMGEGGRLEGAPQAENQPTTTPESRNLTFWGGLGHARASEATVLCKLQQTRAPEAMIPRKLP